ncbi:MAG: glutathione S-transferase [Pseudomonadota bacterium]
MSDFTLHGFAESGNAYKVALMLNLTGQSWDVRFVDFFNGETRTPEFRKGLNPMGEVPVLEHHRPEGDARLTQSGVILDYLAEETGRFGPKTAEEGREVWRWVLFDNHKLTGNTATYRFLARFAPAPEPHVVDFLRKRAWSAFKVLDTHLSDRRFVVADRLTIADLSLCGYLFFEDELGVDWPGDFPGIARWLDRLRAQPGWGHPYDLLPSRPPHLPT